MNVRYWKWEINGEAYRIYRLKNGQFENHKDGTWQQSDRLERAVQDPSFPNISESEAFKLIGQIELRDRLGTDPIKWPKHCLIEYPAGFETQIDLVQQATEITHQDPRRARELIRSVDQESMKRWYIDVALKSGDWRSMHSGIASRNVGKTRKRTPMSQKRLEDLFQRDQWRCRYCGIRVGGNRRHFTAFAKAIDMPELVAGRTDESRHGLYLLLMASYDHVTPHCNNGTDDDDNLVTACWSCQFGKFRYSLAELRLESPREITTKSISSWHGLL